jgi:hypothetical protein
MNAIMSQAARFDRLPRGIGSASARGIPLLICSQGMDFLRANQD